MFFRHLKASKAFAFATLVAISFTATVAHAVVLDLHMSGVITNGVSTELRSFFDDQPYNYNITVRFDNDVGRLFPFTSPGNRLTGIVGASPIQSVKVEIATLSETIDFSPFTTLTEDSMAWLVGPGPTEFDLDVDAGYEYSTFLTSVVQVSLGIDASFFAVHDLFMPHDLQDWTPDLTNGTLSFDYRVAPRFGLGEVLSFNGSVTDAYVTPGVPDSSAPGLPEPSTWSVVIIGLALVGAGLRRHTATNRSALRDA